MMSTRDLTGILDRIGAPVSIINVTPDGRFICGMINKGVEAYYGITREQYIGRDIADFNGISKWDIPLLRRIHANYSRCVATKAQVVVEARHDLPDGSHRWGRATYVPIFDESGEVCQIMATSDDITELKETQSKLEMALTRVLSGFVTICATCKDIKENSDQWVRVERYLDNDANDVQFSHGYCPKCYELAIANLN